METTSYNSHQSQMLMSPRRLDAIRKNGNSIVSPKLNQLNNPDAASQYRNTMLRQAPDQVSQMSKTSKMAFGAQQQQQQPNPDMFNQRDYEAMDAEIAMNSNLHLVPCRWERSGWRYVQKDPADVGFFNNPNRVNNFGVDGSKKRFASQSKRDSFYATQSKSAFGRSQRPRDTTYGRTFASGQRSASNEQAPWNQSSIGKMPAKDPDGIQWAGENHKRQTFKKQKDFIGDWTNVLFRA